MKWLVIMLAFYAVAAAAEPQSPLNSPAVQACMRHAWFNGNNVEFAKGYEKCKQILEANRPKALSSRNADMQEQLDQDAIKTWRH